MDYSICANNFCYPSFKMNTDVSCTAQLRINEPLIRNYTPLLYLSLCLSIHGKKNQMYKELKKICEKNRTHIPKKKETRHVE